MRIGVVLWLLPHFVGKTNTFWLAICRSSYVPCHVLKGWRWFEPILNTIHFVDFENLHNAPLRELPRRRYWPRGRVVRPRSSSSGPPAAKLSCPRRPRGTNAGPGRNLLFQTHVLFHSNLQLVLKWFIKLVIVIHTFKKTVFHIKRYFCSLWCFNNSQLPLSD